MTPSVNSPFVSAHRYFVLCPGGQVTGGPELLHQLVAELVQRGIDASIVYYPERTSWSTPDAYARYQCPTSYSPSDDASSVVIVPEVATQALLSFEYAKRCIWWLSVDNYRGNFETLAQFALFVRRSVVSDIPNPRQVIHLCQSQYALDFIRMRFGIDGFKLSDYLSDEFFHDSRSSTKQDLVLFNPIKGAGATRKILQHARGIRFLPLVNLTRHGMLAALGSAKVYIDFGAHPGKDRIPREAAISGCVVIVGRNGSANNSFDMPIPDRYKFGVLRRRLVVPLIRDIFNNYDDHFASQYEYRQYIHGEHNRFKADVQRLFVPSAHEE